MTRRRRHYHRQPIGHAALVTVADLDATSSPQTEQAMEDQTKAREEVCLPPGWQVHNLALASFQQQWLNNEDEQDDNCDQDDGDDHDKDNGDDHEDGDEDGYEEDNDFDDGYGEDNDFNDGT